MAAQLCRICADAGVFPAGRKVPVRPNSGPFRPWQTHESGAGMNMWTHGTERNERFPEKARRGYSTKQPARPTGFRVSDAELRGHAQTTPEILWRCPGPAAKGTAKTRSIAKAENVSNILSRHFGVA